MSSANAVSPSDEGAVFMPLLYGNYETVPEAVVVCPECGSQLGCEAMQWETVTGRPSKGALNVDCLGDPECEHRYWQSDWQPVVDKIESWCDATDDI